MSDTGSLIQLHHHNNKVIIDLLSENDEKLYYKNKPIFFVSKEENNGIIEKDDGVFINSQFFLTEIQYNTLKLFSYQNNVLYYNNKKLETEYSNKEIEDMIKSIW